MTNMTTDLVKRLEAGETGRGIDAEVLRVFKPDCIITEYVKGDDYLTVFHAEPLVESKHELPALTTSLDATVALVERVKPGCDWILQKTEDGCDARVQSPDHRTDITLGAHNRAPTPAAALLAALLRTQGEG